MIWRTAAAIADNRVLDISLLRTPRARSAILTCWGALICCVTVGSLLSGASAAMQAIGRLPITDKQIHFGAYLALSVLPAVGLRDRRKGILAGLSMFILSVLLEGAQSFAPGRSVEMGDVIANAAGVGFGIALALPIRARVAIP